MKKISKYPEITAVKVIGNPILKKSLKETEYPNFFNKPIPAIFAEAPIGVKLPPNVAPANKP
jgi:hypothetical protein